MCHSRLEGFRDRREGSIIESVMLFNISLSISLREYILPFSLHVAVSSLSRMAPGGEGQSLL